MNRSASVYFIFDRKNFPLLEFGNSELIPLAKNEDITFSCGTKPEDILSQESTSEFIITSITESEIKAEVD